MRKKERIKKQLNYQITFLNNSCRLYDEGYREEALRIAVVLENLISLRKSATSIVRHLGSEDIRLYSTAGNFGSNDNNNGSEGKNDRLYKDIQKKDHRVQFLTSTLITMGERVEIKKTEDLKINIDKISLYLGLGVIVLGNKTEESSYIAELSEPDKSKSSRLVTIGEWMDEIVLITRQKFYITREELIVVARNQDGGGHIAAKIKGNKIKGAYRELSKDAAIGYFVNNKFVHFYGNNEEIFGKEKVSIEGAHYIALRQMAHEVLSSPDFIALHQ